MAALACLLERDGPARRPTRRRGRPPPGEGTIHRLFEAARDNAAEALTALAAAAYFLGFFFAIHGALDKLAY